MKNLEDLSKQIVMHLTTKQAPLNAEYLAFLTGSTVSHIMKEAEKLADVNILRIEGDQLSLNQNNTTYEGWEKFKK